MFIPVSDFAHLWRFYYPVQASIITVNLILVYFVWCVYKCIQAQANDQASSNDDMKKWCCNLSRMDVFM